MTAAPPSASADSIQGLVAGALRAAGDVVRGEIALLRQEMADNVREVAIGVAAMAAAAMFAVVGLLVLIDALVKWLATIVHSEALSALLVGGCLLAVAVILVLVARGRLSASTLVPTRTSRQLRQDAEAIREQVGS